MFRPVAFLAAAVFAAHTFADDARSSQVLGKVSFKTSCSKAAQPNYRSHIT